MNTHPIEARRQDPDQYPTGQRVTKKLSQTGWDWTACRY